VGDDRTGRTVAVLNPTAAQNFYGVTAAADDKTFVLMNYEGARQETTFYLLRLTPGAAHPAQLTKLPSSRSRFTSTASRCPLTAVSSPSCTERHHGDQRQYSSAGLLDVVRCRVGCVEHECPQ